MEATFTMDTERMRQLLSFEPGYKKDASAVSERELLSDFTDMFLARYGMKMVAEDIPEEPAMTEPVAEAPENTGPAEKADPPKPAEEKPVEAPAPAKSSIVTDDMRRGSALLKSHSRIKISLGATDLKLTLEYPAETTEINITGEEYDKYYEIKKARRNTLWGTTEPDDSATYALCEVLDMINTRAATAKDSGTMGKINQFKAYAEKYTGD